MNCNVFMYHRTGLPSGPCLPRHRGRRRPDLRVARAKSVFERRPRPRSRRLFEDGDGRAMDVPVGSRYSGRRPELRREEICTNQFKLLCETAGTPATSTRGTFSRLTMWKAWAPARLAGVRPTAKTKATPTFWPRYKEAWNPGIRRQYRRLPDEGQTASRPWALLKVFPVWNGGEDHEDRLRERRLGRPSSTLVDTVQTTILRPTQNQGEGAGMQRRSATSSPSSASPGNGDQRVLQADLRHRLRHQGLREDAVTAAIQDYFVALAKDWRTSRRSPCRQPGGNEGLSWTSSTTGTSNVDGREPRYQSWRQSTMPSWEGSRMKLKDYWPRCLPGPGRVPAD